ncbi:MAG: efflux RND transporter periplasmic adaptor subunit [Pseudomonadota bacterium]
MKKLLPLVLLLALSACKEPEPPAQVIRPAQVWTVGEQSTIGATTFSGEIRARHEAELAFRVGGKVAQRLIETGQHVATGEVLARLDTADLELSLASARANLAAAEADLANGEQELARLRPLHQQKFIGKSVLDSAQAARDAAAARVSAARAQMNLSANQARYTELRADKPGVITATALEAGQVVATGAPVIRMAYDGEREAHVRVGETTAQALQPGSAVQVTLWAQADQTLAGRVREIAPATDATRSFLVKVSLLEPPTDLRLGMTANVSLPASAAQDTHTLPASALFQRERDAAVWVLDADDTLHLRPVSVLSYRQDGVLVSGLEPGERLLAAGVHTVTEGQKVRPIPYDGTSAPSPRGGEGWGEGAPPRAAHPLPGPPPSRGREPSGGEARADS